MNHEALLYDALSEKQVRCNVCQRRCVIADGKLGWCQTRQNREGKLYSLIYSRVASLAVSPIEKKPVFHFFPGSRWLSLGSLGCNFRCPGCQNWELGHYTTAGPPSRKLRAARLEEVQLILPDGLVRLAKEQNCLGISWTYNEPTLWFEYSLEGAKLAKANGLFTNYVTNGYMTPEALDAIGPYLDVYRADIKGFTTSFYKDIAHIPDFHGILEVTQRAKERWGMWVEIVTNIIPGFSDDEPQLRAMASWIKQCLGASTPWHVTRFHPHLDLSHIPPTPVSVLERAREIGFEEGLQYVYLGNVPGHPGENTYCPKCKTLLISRESISVQDNKIAGGKCPDCDLEIAGRF
jgi:pyruvate formate lyase activating enzyme